MSNSVKFKQKKYNLLVCCNLLNSYLCCDLIQPKFHDTKVPWMSWKIALNPVNVHWKFSITSIVRLRPQYIYIFHINMISFIVQSWIKNENEYDKSTLKLKMNAQCTFRHKKAKKCAENFGQKSHTVPQRQPVSITHIMTLRSCPERSTCPHCAFNYGPIVRNLKKTLFFLLSSLTIRPPASCLRKYLLWDAPSLLTNNQKGFLPIKRKIKMWRVLHTRPSEKGSSNVLPRHKAGGSKGSHFLFTYRLPSASAFGFCFGSSWYKNTKVGD